MIALVLAGGRASRMGGDDKGLRPVGAIPILGRVFAALAPQCDTILLNANGDPSRFAAFGRPVVADSLSGQLGPLAGVLAGMEHVRLAYPAADRILTVPGDAPFLPHDLVERLAARQRVEGAAIVQARSGDRTHGVVAIWSLALRDDLRRAIVDDGLRRVGAFAARHAAVVETWSIEPVDPFLNVNTPDDLAMAECLVARRS